MRKRHTQHGHKVAALFCLLAVVLLQAPFARAAWFTSTICCMGDHCPIPSHHHKSTTAESEMPMDCGHHSSKASNCTMSCCKTSDDAAIDISQFLVPAPHGSLFLERAVTAVPHIAPQMLSRSEEPQSPPPRTFLA
jgi:hypothetical protein